MKKAKGERKMNERYNRREKEEKGLECGMDEASRNEEKAPIT